MYSRKYIRSPAAVPSTERISSNSGTPLSIAPRAEERSVTLPPDYTGMAFSGGGKNSSLQNPGDYPETLIPPLAEEIPSAEGDDAPLLSAEEEETGELVSSSPPLSELSMPLAGEDAFPLQAEEALLYRQAEESPPSLEPETESAPIAEPNTAQESSPLLTPELLRSLTLEDLLLFWMLLMLTVSSQEDQIYLLLGLLLFQR